MRIKIILILVVWPSLVIAQHPYWVHFTNKEGTHFNPEAYFAPKALERIARQGLDPHHISNYPLNPAYIKAVGKIADSTGFASRWFNMLATYANGRQIATIRKLPFVKKAMPMHLTSTRLAADQGITPSKFQRGLIYKQTQHMQGALFRKNGYTGKDVRIAIFDGGFPGVNTHPMFAHILKENRILRTWDFPDDEAGVFEHNKHGTMVMSCIAGKLDTMHLGLAPEATFLLARTEVRTEPFSEEENWLAAAEWADKHGADIINSSLGYTYHRYFPEEMNGEHTLVARAANMAASKGILVVNAMGNSGANKHWRIMGSPADADSVLSIGGLNPKNRYHTSFSSFGPTADMRKKPNVSAFAHVIAASPGGGITKTQGTSFSSPLVAGFAACALQANPGLKAMELFRKVESAGHLYPYYDYAHGYGVPQASLVINANRVKPDTTLTILQKEDRLTFRVFPKFIGKGQKARNYLYYHIEKPNGVLRQYALIRVNQSDAYYLRKSEITAGETIKVHYKGYTALYQVK